MLRVLKKFAALAVWFLDKNFAESTNSLLKRLLLFLVTKILFPRSTCFIVKRDHLPGIYSLLEKHGVPPDEVVIGDEKVSSIYTNKGIEVQVGVGLTNTYKFFLGKLKGIWILFHLENKETVNNWGDTIDNGVGTLLVRKKDVVQFLLLFEEQYKDSVVKDSVTFVSIVSVRSGKNDRNSGSIPTRHFDSVVLDPVLKANILEDSLTWLKNKDWYISNDIPWRRGYIFKGPPGVGKTSTIKALAAALKLTIQILNISSDSKDEDIVEIKLRSGAIVVVEDFDRLLSKETCFSVSSLLNLLDGICSATGSIIVLTSNSTVEIPDALRRPGRIDREFTFEYPSIDIICELLCKLYKVEIEECFSLARNLYEVGNVSQAEIQGFVQRYPVLEEAIENIEIFKEIYRSDDGNSIGSEASSSD